MIVIDNTKYEEAFSILGEESGRVKASVNMFVEAINIVAKYGYAILVNEDGEDIAVFRFDGTTYDHSYRYSGGLDLTFLNEYEVLILRGCNEYSLELCLTALKLWSGKKVIFAGADWQFAIDLLPDIEGKECIWEDELPDEIPVSLTEGKKYLDVRVFIPFQEPLDRYLKGIMCYDEVMTFTFLFSDLRQLGNKNPDKRFLVIDAMYGNLGLFALFGKAVSVAKYVKKKGFFPVFVIKNRYGSRSIYQDYDQDDIWSKFYNQPEGIKVSDVMQSKNVCFTPCFYNGSIMMHIMDEYSKGIRLSWPNGIYNKTVNDYLTEKEKIFLPFPDRTLGVLARGTDYSTRSFKNHSIHASKELLAEKIRELLAAWDLEYIFIATEDAIYCDYFKKEFGDRVYFTDQERYTTKPGEMLADVHRKQETKADAFHKGADYVLAVYLLSKCNSFLASGQCAGVTKAVQMNEGRFKEKYIFDLGKVK